jgi:hypothetical protein
MDDGWKQDIKKQEPRVKMDRVRRKESGGQAQKEEKYNSTKKAARLCGQLLCVF